MNEYTIYPIIFAVGFSFGYFGSDDYRLLAGLFWGAVPTWVIYGENSW